MAAAIFGTRVSIREKSHKVIDDLRRGASTTTSTGTVSTVTSTVTGIGPITTGIVGIEAAVQTGGGRKAVDTGLNMTEEECRLIIEVMSVAGSVRGTGIGTVTAEDHHHRTGPTKKIIKEQEAALQVEKERDPDGRRKEKGGLRARVPTKKKTTLVSKTKSQRRMHLKKMKMKMMNYLNQSGFAVPILKAIIQMTPWIKWGTLLW